MITLYNTLTRQKEVFKPIEPGKVKMYVCGPTVYNYIHIGNARPAINYDVVRRYFEYQGYNVEYVSNFTDVDDKLIKRSQELNQSVPEIAEKYIAAFHEDVGALNVRKATSNPRVMDHMDDIIQFIKELVDQGYAYESGGDVYFRTRKFEGYGKLSHQSIDDLKVGARIDAGEHKEDALDFTLWKKAKPGEISWDSPFGEGRPGWHIECSVMAFHELGPTIDIHAGGSDLQFPHHENEIAQSEAHNHASFANYWMHNGFINIDNEKMSKSLGNFILVHDIIKEVDPDVLRFFMISVHYRSPINYNLELVESARSGLERIRNSYQLIEERAQIATNIENQQTYIDQIDAILNRFETVMNDDFNTANAITAWYDLAKLANKYVLENTTSTEVIDKFKAVYQIFSDVLGVPLKSKNADELLDEDVEKLIEERNEARKNKDFARADEIRDMLKSQNIILEDTPQGVRFKRG
ncbi:cysteinyl-tRNA synthetase [Staphylococcus aureus VET1026S]|uniref:cysteine--tRNA ligase n=1 Tax=Staphylococcus aureus TaxID=1280 RepID=UPI0004459092|nr:cysteine--tRNA ligase [Staphylococcus aureus]EZR76396.1 cysteinyl-tRNA synthetase [Staphylococcus aureus VET1373S]EZR79573.1 cysteinyl-tRNA synthetase [Staphylococcus aureus VET1368S]KAG13345.1 cysteinyl-tRNA synthetase [Staphylococcus aureus VET0632S]KAG19472.1 cysteinyl-tRNA synthetase [Staphylococcus aureus VET0678S]KAG22984.1 cysteinyl-tRNA synthetase [Staphylococcus aureus VET0679S]